MGINSIFCVLQTQHPLAYQIGATSADDLVERQRVELKVSDQELLCQLPEV